MAQRLVHHETPMEYFKGMVEGAMARQGISSSEEATFYLVNMLTGFVCLDGRDGMPLGDEPLAVRLARALQSGGIPQREGLRQVGDVSLFISGFFSESLSRKLVDVDYYIALGGYAYGSLGRRDEDACAEIFSELAEKFVSYVDVLAEVSERSSIGTNSELLRLYEKWLRTGSRRDGELLVQRGIVPNASIGSRFLQ
ncbi:MAG TPA: hypothetical protein VNK41_11895 [Vicinamibacterales bacterium]|nr:hypothetical protein [Vicinamibacterales bacterium]